MSPFMGVSGLSGPGSLIGSSGEINLSENYWFTRIYNNTGSGSLTYSGGLAVAIDNVTGSVYFGGANKMTKTTHSGTIGKLNIDGTLAWTRSLSSSTAGEEKIQSLACDSSGNVYGAGYCDTAGYTTGSRDYLICKYNSSGTLQWQRMVGDTRFETGDGITVDSSDNVFVTGYSVDPFNSYDPVVFKFNSSGTLQWQKLHKDFTYQQKWYSRGIITDSSGNIYFGGQHYNASSGSSGFVHKSNSAGVTQWMKKLTSSSSGSIQGRNVAVDSSGNVYLCGHQDKEQAPSGGSEEWFISKFNSSGTLQWTRILGGDAAATGGVDEARGIAVDSSGNIFVGGHIRLGSAYRVHLIAKWNSSGVFQWQRYMTHTNIATQDNYGYDLKVDREDNVYYIGTASQDIVIFKVPGDGSLTGSSYDSNNLTYDQLTSSSATGNTTITQTFGSVFSGTDHSQTSSTTASHTDAAGTLTSSSITLTADVSTIL